MPTVACNQFRSESCIACEAGDVCLVQTPAEFSSAPGDMVHHGDNSPYNNEESDWSCCDV